MDRCGGCAAVIIIEFPTENIIFPERSILEKKPLTCPHFKFIYHRKW